MRCFGENCRSSSLFSVTITGPVAERTNMVFDGCATNSKTACHDWSKPKCECYNLRRYDDRKSQNNVSEKVHY
jgi:hypothetical protein